MAKPASSAKFVPRDDIPPTAEPTPPPTSAADSSSLCWGSASARLGFAPEFDSRSVDDVHLRDVHGQAQRAALDIGEQRVKRHAIFGCLVNDVEIGDAFGLGRGGADELGEITHRMARHVPWLGQARWRDHSQACHALR